MPSSPKNKQYRSCFLACANLMLVYCSIYLIYDDVRLFSSFFHKKNKSMCISQWNGNWSKIPRGKQKLFDKVVKKWWKEHRMGVNWNTSYTYSSQSHTFVPYPRKTNFIQSAMREYFVQILSFFTYVPKNWIKTEKHSQKIYIWKTFWLNNWI